MTAAILFLGDAICLAAFVLVGMQGHETLGGQNAAVRIAINLGPLLLVWAVAGLALGAFRLAPAASGGAAGAGAVPPTAVPPATAAARLPSFLARTLLAWLVAAPLALLLRAGLLGSSILVVAFVVVTLSLGGALLLAWRTVYFLIARRRAASPDLW